MTKGRTISNYWLLTILDEGYILMNSLDAAKLGIRHAEHSLTNSQLSAIFGLSFS